jgi:Short repeat of unknown function (DUF308)
MDAEPRTAATLEGMMAARAARYWWAVLLAGIAWLLIAWVVLHIDVRSLVAVGVLMGAVFLGAAVNEAALASAVTSRWQVLRYVLAVGFMIAAVWAFVRPINTFFALASVLGLILILEGAFEIMRSVASRGENPYWWVAAQRVPSTPPTPPRLLGLQLRPRVQPGEAGRPHPAVGRLHGSLPGGLADHAGPPPAPAEGRASCSRGRDDAADPGSGPPERGAAGSRGPCSDRLAPITAPIRGCAI